MKGPATAVLPPERTVVLVGLMGAGKSSVGRRLAKRFNLPFVDSDEEITKAASMSIEEIFERFGEAYFREGERRVIARLLDGGPQVLAIGGGGFMDPETRSLIRTHGISIWLKAELDVLVGRTEGRSGRPLLKSGDPRARLAALMTVRYPVYAEADITITTGDSPIEGTVNRIVEALQAFQAERGAEVPVR